MESGICYNQPVSKEELKIIKEETNVLLGRTSYQGHEYKMFFKVKKKVGLNCFDVMMCSYLDQYEPDLISWKYASKYCIKNNMSLLMVGSKEEELHAVSLQTSASKGGRRYDMHLVYLGISSEVYKIFPVCPNKNIFFLLKASTALLFAAGKWILHMARQNTISLFPVESMALSKKCQCLL